VPWPSEGTINSVRGLWKKFCNHFTMHGTLENYVKIEINDVDSKELQGPETALVVSPKVKFIVSIPSLAGARRRSEKISKLMLRATIYMAVAWCCVGIERVYYFDSLKSKFETVWERLV